MELKVRDVASAWQSANILANRKLKIQPSFWLARQIKKIQVTHATYQEQHAALVRQYGVITPGGEEWKVLPEHEQKFDTEHKALLETQVNEEIEPRPVSYLGLEDIEPALLLNLWFLFTEETPA